MADKELDIRKIIDRRRESSDKDYQTMMNFFYYRVSKNTEPTTEIRK